MNSVDGQSQDTDSHNQNHQKRSSRDSKQSQEHDESHHDEIDDEDKRYSAYTDPGSSGLEQEDDDGPSNRGSHKSERHSTRQSHPPLEKPVERFSDEQRTSEDTDEHHVHFKNKPSMTHATSKLPPLPPGTKQRSQSSDGPREELARASWTTASFTELPNALDELTEQHHPSKTSTKEHHHHMNANPAPVHDHKELENKGADKKATEKKKSPHPVERSSSTDLQSVLIKQGKHNQTSILTKYLRPTMSDEATQAGIPSWDWLSRLEQMLIHFFLMVFESSNDSSKLIMEMMSTDAGLQIEEIFQLLLKAEPDMYKELGHLVTLAEKWLIHWRGDSEERHRALDYVRLYMQGVKDKNYYALPVQVRLHKLGTFIAGLKVMGKDTPNKLPRINFPSYKVHPPAPENQFRVGSPRVKPATHFSQVVANILCARTCDNPLPKADVYADKLGRNVFKNTLHGDEEFKTYTDKKYGNMYQKRELFFKDKNNRQLELEIQEGGGDAEFKPLGRADCVQNVHCWIPKYTKSYVQTLQDTGCEVFAKADFEKSIKVKECRMGKGANDRTCKDIKAIKPKKLYDWVRGQDGKVHRRLVGSYTELGATASTSKLMGTPDAAGRHGRKPHGQQEIGFRFGKKGAGGRAASDTRLGRKAYETKKSQTSRATKGRYTNTSKERPGKDDRFKKAKMNNARTAMNAFKVDGVSLDGSGDSGQENGRMRKDLNKKGTIFNIKQGKKGATTYMMQTAKGGRGEYNKPGGGYGSSYNKARTQADYGKGGSGRDYRDNARNRENSRDYRDNGRNRENSRDYRDNGRKRENSRDYRDNGRNRENSRDYRDNGRKRENSRDYRDNGRNRENSRDYRDNGRNRENSRSEYRSNGRNRENSRSEYRSNGRNRENSRGDYRDNTQRGTGRDYRGNEVGGGGGGGEGRQRGGSHDYKDKGIVNIYNKNKLHKFGARQNQRNFKSYKRGRFPLHDDEWAGEDWSPGSEFSYIDNDSYKQGNLQLLSLNQCWEKASKLFKKPSKALVIPPAENLMLYLEKKFASSKWSRGSPIALRNYPNGSTFVAQYGNGSSKVFYPHGGLAVAISAPSPVTSQVLPNLFAEPYATKVVRDPSDHVFFFDKALLADLNSAGNGIIYGDDGIIKAQYSAIGGFKLDNLEKGRRWHWNHGGQRMLMKLNKFMSLRISDHDKIFLNFFGNHRGFLVNVASGQEVILVNPNSKTTKVDPILDELKNLVRPKAKDDNFDYIRGKFNPRPTLGFVDKAKHYISVNDMELPETTKFQDSTPDEYFVKLMSRTLSPGNGNGDMAGDFMRCANMYRDNNTFHIRALPVCCNYNTVNNSNN